MDLSRFSEIIEEIAPLSLQESWDNSGFQINLGGSVTKVLVALELTEAVINEAIHRKADLILVHHPMYFNPLKRIDVSEPIGRKTELLIKNGISVYASHTPFDICDGGNNDRLGELLDFRDIGLMDGDESGICRMGVLEGAGRTIEEFISHACLRLKLDKGYVNYAGKPFAVIKKAGWCTGSGSEFAELALENECDLFITGDLKYHQAEDAREKGINVLDLGHFGTEQIFTENMAEKLEEHLAMHPEISEKPEIMRSFLDINPFTVIR